MSTESCTEAMKEAFEAKYSRDWNDPTGDEMKAIWSASWVAAMDARLPTRESVADDIGVLVLNGDLPFDMEDLADWVQAGHLPVVKQK